MKKSLFNDVELSNRIKLLKKMKDVQRLSGTKIIKSYCLAEHCYYTGLLFKEIAEKELIEYTNRELYFVLTHDLPEVVTGDMLYPAKQIIKEEWKKLEYEIIKELNPGLINYTEEMAEKYFTEETWKLFRACDTLELLLFLQEEISLGNNSVDIMKVHTKCYDLLFSPELYYATVPDILMGARS